MLKLNQNGALNSLLPALLISVLLLIGAVIFGGWAYNSRQSYKNDVDAKIAVAVVAAKQQQIKSDDAEFATAEKSPLQTYDGPEAYGSIILSYPKTWSAYIDTTGDTGQLIDAYFSPGYVSAISAATSVFSLRLQVQNHNYSSVVEQLAGAIKRGTLTAQPYSLPKLPTVVGLELTGKLPGENGASGTEVILPVRNETIVLWITAPQFLSDFNTYILPNFSFSP